MVSAAFCSKAHFPSKLKNFSCRAVLYCAVPQAHGYIVKVEQPYGKICRHAYMVPLARYAYLAAYAQAQSLAHNLGKRLVRRASDASLLYMPFFYNSLALGSPYWI